MGIAGVDFLHGHEHGYYERHPKARKRAVEDIRVSTDRIDHPFAVVCGVVVNMHAHPHINITRGKPGDVHAELQLITGTAVVSWERDLIVELWKLGASVTVHSHNTPELARRMRLREEGQPMGWPALYEVARFPSGVAASAYAATTDCQ